MTATELRDQIFKSNQELKASVSSGMNHQRNKERLKNLLLENVDTIIEVLGGTKAGANAEELEARIAELEEENESLGDALAEQDAQVKGLKMRIAELEAAKKNNKPKSTTAS